jgi:hypothetical protein
LAIALGSWSTLSRTVTNEKHPINAFDQERRNLHDSLTFSVKPGDVAYIGNFHANSLTMCLSNTDDFAKAVIDIKKAHPFLANVAITNLSHGLQFPGWPNTKATDVFGKGLCKVQ